jgi:hypothetical protein
MNLKTFLETFTAAVARDADLGSWAKRHFGQLTVYKDIPSDTFPDIEDDFPFVVLLPTEKQSNQEWRRIEYGLDAWLGLNIATYKTRADGNVTEADGVDLICDFIEKVKAAVVAAQPEGFTVTFIEEIDTLPRPPEVHGFITMEFIQKLVIGMDPLA